MFSTTFPYNSVLSFILQHQQFGKRLYVGPTEGVLSDIECLIEGFHTGFLAWWGSVVVLVLELQVKLDLGVGNRCFLSLSPICMKP